MNLLDIIIVLAAIAYGIGGFRSGAVIGVCSLIGFFGGAAIGAQLAEPLGSRVADGRAQVPVAIVCVLVLATIGQILAVYLGGRLKNRIVRGRGRPVDSAVGAVLGVLSVLLVAWMIAVPLASSPYPTLASEASQSKIVRGVNDSVPQGVRSLYSSLRAFLDQSGFPPVFGDLPPANIVDVPSPSQLTPAQQRVVQGVRRSTFKILGQAPECQREIEGSGFVYAKHRVLTNAHVVAGTRRLVVQTDQGPLAARVVLFDPQSDVAVLAVPDLNATPLSFASSPAKTGDSAVVLGYPENGPFTAGPARVREKSTVGGRDIYDQRGVQREIYSVRGTVRSGNSGGPLINDNGSVLGMVFARALANDDTGYVLSDDQIRADARKGQSQSSAVSTQGCTSD
ncbi:MarP family serine protease [uncultured Jatrophihabitans sp.]|uniref:MarP family serine protease n=1 Tax=uncultured Jatrophihabitans sp. TaxID=1610747 RepID=UPI0035CC4BCA